MQKTEIIWGFFFVVVVNDCFTSSFISYIYHLFREGKFQPLSRVCIALTLKNVWTNHASTHAFYCCIMTMLLRKRQFYPYNYKHLVSFLWSMDFKPFMIIMVILTLSTLKAFWNHLSTQTIHFTMSVMLMDFILNNV